MIRRVILHGRLKELEELNKRAQSELRHKEFSQCVCLAQSNAKAAFKHALEYLDENRRKNGDMAVSFKQACQRNKEIISDVDVDRAVEVYSELVSLKEPHDYQSACQAVANVDVIVKIIKSLCEV